MIYKSPFQPKSFGYSMIQILYLYVTVEHTELQKMLELV